MARVTIIIPTHNHTRLLMTAVRSVLRQSVQDLEIFIIGDGITAETRGIIPQVLALDGRTRFFDHPKSPRTGEPYRHLALQEATGSVVCYLSDDDLWMPDHLEITCRALEQADMVHAIPLRVNADDTITTSLLDLAVPEWAKWTLDGNNKICLSFAGHTMDFYRRLPHGWRTTPPCGLATDHYMWQQMLAVPGMRASGTGAYTAISFPSILRRDWTLERREEELLAWEEKILNRSGAIREEARRSMALTFYHLETGRHALDSHIQHLRAENETLARDLKQWEQRRKALPGFLRNLLRWYWKRRGL